MRVLLTGMAGAGKSTLVEELRRRGHAACSNHHDDGTPGTAVLVEARGVAELHAEFHATGYRHMLAGLEPHPRGREVTVIDPVFNRLRFFERTE